MLRWKVFRQCRHFCLKLRPHDLPESLVDRCLGATGLFPPVSSAIHLQSRRRLDRHRRRLLPTHRLRGHHHLRRHRVVHRPTHRRLRTHTRILHRRLRPLHHRRRRPSPNLLRRRRCTRIRIRLLPLRRHQRIRIPRLLHPLRRRLLRRCLHRPFHRPRILRLHILLLRLLQVEVKGCR